MPLKGVEWQTKAIPMEGQAAGEDQTPLPVRCYFNSLCLGGSGIDQ